MLLIIQLLMICFPWPWKIEHWSGFLNECMLIISFLFWQSFWLGWIVGSWPLFWALFISFLLGTAYSINVSWFCSHIYYSDSSDSCMVQLNMCYHYARCIKLLWYLNHIQCRLLTRNAKANLTTFRISEPLLALYQTNPPCYCYSLITHYVTLASMFRSQKPKKRRKSFCSG